MEGSRHSNLCSSRRLWSPVRDIVYFIEINLQKIKRRSAENLAMERAVEAARQGDLSYFSPLPADELSKLLKLKDEDQRSLLHTACGSNLGLVQFLAVRGAQQHVNDVDEEVGRIKER